MVFQLSLVSISVWTGFVCFNLVFIVSASVMKVHHFVNSRYLHMINSDTVKMKEVAQQAGLWDFSWYWWITALGIKIYPIMAYLVRSTENYYFNLSLRWCEAKPFKLVSETFEKVSGGYRGGGSNEYITSNCRPGKMFIYQLFFFRLFCFSFFILFLILW